MAAVTRKFLVAALLAAAMAAGPRARAAGDHGVDTPMDLDPQVTGAPRIPSFNERLKGLWVAVLERPEPDLRMHALDAFAQARSMGMEGLEDLAGKISGLVADDKQPAAVQLSAARALIALDARATGPAILAREKTALLEFAMVADPALARWKTAGAAELWMSRLKEKGVSDQLVCSAMRSLGEAGAAEAVEPLIGYARDVQQGGVTRLTAARALASFPTERVISLAETLAGSKSDHLLAAAMAPASKDPHAVTLLLRLATDAEPAVATIAVQKLLLASPESLAPLIGKLADNHDAMIRGQAVEAAKRLANGENIAILGKRLDDDTPRVRIAAREALIECDNLPGLRAAVRKAGLSALEAPGAHGEEQAALVLGSLDEKSARDRLLVLMKAPQIPVRLAAVVGLRRLKLPETAKDQLERATAIEAGFSAAITSKQQGVMNVEAMDIELSQLLQNLGLAHYMPAEKLMLKLVPKNSGGEKARSGAIWALGYLHESSPDAGLSQQLTGRLTDTNLLNPESPLVRAISAISIGRMRDKSAGTKAALSRTATEEVGTRIAEACRWATAQIDGVPFKPLPAQPNPVTGWFLEPIE